MMQPTSTGPETGPKFAACIGLDWADQKHTWALKTSGARVVERGEVDNTPEAMDALISDLTQRFGPQPLAIALEQSRGSVVAKLSKYSNVVLYPIHPKAAADYRSCFQSSGAKSDPADSALLLEMLDLHRDHLRPLQPDTVETRMLLVLTEQRRNLVDQQTAYNNQLRDTLKQIFSQALDWLDQLHSAMACDFLRGWPTLQALKRSRPQTIRDFSTSTTAAVKNGSRNVWYRSGVRCRPRKTRRCWNRAR